MYEYVVCNCIFLVLFYTRMIDTLSDMIIMCKLCSTLN